MTWQNQKPEWFQKIRANGPVSLGCCNHAAHLHHHHCHDSHCRLVGVVALLACPERFLLHLQWRSYCDHCQSQCTHHGNCRGGRQRNVSATLSSGCDGPNQRTRLCTVVFGPVLSSNVWMLQLEWRPECAVCPHGATGSVRSRIRSVGVYRQHRVIRH
jgi:hypothetical protein